MGYQPGRHHVGRPGPVSEELTPPASPESVVESVRMTRQRVGHNCQSERFSLYWKNPDGTQRSESKGVCLSCEISGGHAPTGPSHVMAEFITPAVLAYIVRVPTKVETGSPEFDALNITSWDFEGRVALMDVADAEASSLSGPGIFPVPIERIEDEDSWVWEGP
jgi:hypothetical protein